MTRIYVKPAVGRAAPDPEKGYQLLPAAGGLVPDNAYWQRRLKDKDVIQSEAPEDVPAAELVAPKAVKGSKE
ncbi:DUF2635 domain-containing protein [Pseudomonas fragi]|uniref:DUF2635 domain-containing protein n=1 Tax=Pseudomonas fragi TaxID=296 RepID=UPI001C52794A|nr:DUF2635 domain-containing protein [Pseudomonas fragi]